MKILHIDPDDIDNPLSGGGPRRTFEIYRRLARRHDITVLTPTFPGSTPELVRDNVRYVRLGRKVGDHGSSHHITFFFSLARALRRFDYDLLVEDFMPPMSVTYVPLLNRKPMVASVQWFFAELLSRQYKLPFFLGERYGIRLYRDFVVLTENMSRLIQSRHRHANCTVIPNAVDQRLFDVTPDYGDYLLFIGRVDMEQKGVDLLLDAYVRIPVAERIPLILAGHGFAWEAVKTRIAALGLARWVQMPGKVDEAERNRLLSGARAVCIPSRDETFGMVILEACAAARPVALFDRAPMSEVAAPDGCLLAPPFDVEAYALAMRKLITESPAQNQARGEICRNWARQYNWDRIALQQEALYQSVVDRRHHGVAR